MPYAVEQPRGLAEGTKRRPEIEVAIEGLKRECETLEKSCAELEGRLSIVLTVIPPKDKPVTGGRPTNTALASNLAEVERAIARASEFIRSLTERVEL